ncbi:MAG: UDP-glucose 4-epimerase GalE [Patescibacteria group bacterium]
MKELLEAAAGYPGGFIILEDNRPKFAILDYEHYKRLAAGKAKEYMNQSPTATILITGGAGYIGSHAGKLLVERGFEVTTLDNLSKGRKEFAQGRFIEGDLADAQFLDGLFAQNKFDAVMHFAASIEVEESVKNPELYYANNVVAGLNLLNAMAKHGVSNLIFSSTCAVYAESAPVPLSENSAFGPISPYAKTKYIFEQILGDYAAAYGVKSVALRYFNAAGASFDQTLGFFNPHPSHLIPRVLDVAAGKNESLTVFGGDYKTHDGTAIRDYIHVSDLAEAHFLALNYLLENKSSSPLTEAFNVGSGRGYSVLEIINAVCEQTGHMVRFEMGPRRAGDREKLVSDNTKIAQVLGFKPAYSDLKNIIDTSWAWRKKWFGNN